MKAKRKQPGAKMRRILYQGQCMLNISLPYHTHSAAHGQKKNCKKPVPKTNKEARKSQQPDFEGEAIDLPEIDGKHAEKKDSRCISTEKAQPVGGYHRT